MIAIVKLCWKRHPGFFLLSLILGIFTLCAGYNGAVLYTHYRALKKEAQQLQAERIPCVSGPAQANLDSYHAKLLALKDQYILKLPQTLTGGTHQAELAHIENWKQSTLDECQKEGIALNSQFLSLEFKNAGNALYLASYLLRPLIESRPNAVHAFRLIEKQKNIYECHVQCLCKTHTLRSYMNFLAIHHPKITINSVEIHPEKEVLPVLTSTDPEGPTVALHSVNSNVSIDFEIFTLEL